MISNGSPVAAETDNAAFMSRTQDTSTVGKVNLNNGSSASITDVQSTMNVQRSDINQNASDIDALEAALAVDVANLTAHGNLTTNTHGISSGNIVGTSMVQTLTNKSFGDNILPTTNNNSDLGSSSLKIKNIYAAGNASIDGNLTLGGDLTVNGNTTTVNTATLDVEDANITVNKGGTTSTADTNKSGITVNCTDGSDAVIGYNSTLTSKFKAGVSGSEAEIATVSHSQTLTNKTIVAGNNSISGLLHGTQVNNPSSGVHGVTGSVVGTSDIQTLSNKTIGDSVTLTNISTPSNPSSGFIKVYSKSDSKIYKLDHTGVETEIGVGTAGDVAAHAALTANTHGVTGNIVGTSDTQTITNKSISGYSNTITNVHIPNWVSNNSYVSGQILKYTATEGAYLIRCTTSHTSATSFFDDVQAGYWEMTTNPNNLLMNGGFDTWQRGTSITPVATGKHYTADRWSTYLYSASTVNVQVTTGSTGTSWWGAQVRRIASGNTYNFLCQELSSRDSKALCGKTITLSYYAKKSSNFTGYLSVELHYGTGLDESWTAMTGDTVFANNSPNISTALQKFTLTAYVPFDANQLAIEFKHVPGAFVSVESFYLENVMLNIGPAPATFARYGSNVHDELLACQRYYEKSTPKDTFPGINDGTSMAYLWTGKLGDSGGILGKEIRYRVEKRASPLASGVYIWDQASSPNGGTTHKISTRNAGGAQTNNLSPTSVSYSATALSVWHTISTSYAGIEFNWAVSADF